MARAEDTIRKTIDRAQALARKAQSVEELRFAALLVSNSQELLNTLVKTGMVGSDQALKIIERTAPVRRAIITKATAIGFRPSQRSISAIGSMAETADIYQHDWTVPALFKHAMSPEHYDRWSVRGMQPARRFSALRTMTAKSIIGMQKLPLLPMPKYKDHKFKVRFQSMIGPAYIVGDVLPNGQLFPKTVLREGMSLGPPGTRVVDLTERVSVFSV